MIFNDVTVVAIYGHSDGASSIPSLLTSTRELPGSHGLLLSVRRPVDLPDRIEWRPVYPMDYRQYNVFVMHGLYAFIETGFALIVQDDGWVFNGSAFSPDYFNYDYIGAPCHAAIVNGELQTQYSWRRSEQDVTIIQNGGLSLRSKRMLEALNRHGLMYAFEPQHNEDVQITGVYRKKLEDCGLRIAPTEIAKNFAVEYFGPLVHDGIEFAHLLGCHGNTRKLVAEKRIRCQATLARVSRVHRELEFLHYLKTLGYEIEIPQG